MKRATRTARLRAKLFAGPEPPAILPSRFEALRKRIGRFNEIIQHSQTVQVSL